jgi:hypothetical protein
MIAERIELENSYRMLKPEQSKRLAEIGEHFKKLRYEARQKLSNDIADLAKNFYNAMQENHSIRQKLWIEKMKIENSQPVDIDALVANQEAHAKNKRYANELAQAFDDTVKRLKREYKMYKLSLASLECSNINSVRDEISRRRSDLLGKIASLKLKGLQNG